MVHTTPATLLALTGLAATATAYKHTSTDRMKCATALTQEADYDYPTCTSPSKLDCFCAQPFDPSRVSRAAREVCEGVHIPTEYIPRFICRDYYDSDGDGDSDDDGDGRYEMHRHHHDHTCHHGVYDDDDNDDDSDDDSDGNRDIHRISHPMMRVPASEASSSDAAKHNPNGQLQSKRAYAPGLSPSASSSFSAHRALVTNAPSSPGSKTESEGHENEYENGKSAGRVITEVHTYTSCDCSSSTVASARVPSQSPSAYLHQGAIPVAATSSSSAHLHQSAIPVSSSSMLAGAHSHVHGPASMYVSIPVSVPEPAPTGVDAQRSGYPSGRKMASSSGVPSASPSPSVMTYDVDDGAVAGVLMPSSVVMVGLTALMAFFM